SNQDYSHYPHDKPSEFYEQQPPADDYMNYGRSDEMHANMNPGDQYVGSDEDTQRGIFTKTEVDEYGTPHERVSKSKSTAVAAAGVAALFAMKKGYDYYTRQKEEKAFKQAQDMNFQSNNTLFNADKPDTYNPYSQPPPPPSNPSHHPPY
ncbi:hypothetical protein LPJ70_007396, partial [Coemansia sp. RSA 2708]